MPHATRQPRALQQKITAVNPDAEANVGPRPACPRCDYDLTGHAGGWTQECPLEGRCSECGLGFRWGTVLNPALQSLPWLYEHSPRWWSARAWLETTIRAAFPWHFWRRVELHHRVAPFRLALWASGLIVLPMILALFVSTSAMLLMWGIRKISPPSFINYSPITAVSGPTLLDLRTGKRDFTITQDGVSVTIPLPNDEASDAYTGTLTPLPEPLLARTDLGPVLMIFNRRTGGWRQIAESELVAAIDSPFLEDETNIAFMRSGPARDALMFGPMRWVAPDGLVMPAEIIVVYARWSPNPGKYSLRDSALGPLGVIIGGEFGAGLGGDGVAPYLLYSNSGQFVSWDRLLAGPLAFLLVAVVIVLASPSEWRRAHVRSEHLARVAAYSLLPVGVMTLALALAVMWAYVGYAIWYFTGAPSRAFFPAPGGMFTTPGVISMLLRDGGDYAFAALTALWAPIHWWFALRRGIKLRRTWPLWFFVTVGGWLAAYNAILYINDFTPGY